MAGAVTCQHIANATCDHIECVEFAYGPLYQPAPGPPEWTIEDECAAHDHAYYGDHEDRGRCYCGEVMYPLGGPHTEGDK